MNQSEESRSTLIWIAAEPWDTTNFARPQQIPRLLARRGWSVDYAVPQPSLLRRIRRKGREDWRDPCHELEPGIRVHYLSAPFPGGHRSPLARRLNSMTARRGMARLLSPPSTPLPLIVVNSPALLEFWPPEAPVIYDCHDAITTFDWATEAYSAIEQRLFREARATVFSAQPLMDRYGALCRRSVLIRNGCHPEDFSIENRNAELPEDLARIPEPRVGFYGLLGPWLDYELIRTVAARLPKVQWVMIGRAEVPPEVLPQATNIHYLGRKPYARLVDYLRGFRVSILPFLNNRLTEAVNPVKVYEYLAAGCPVVSTQMPELEELGRTGLIEVRGNSESFAGAVDTIIRSTPEPAAASRRIAFAREQSWSRRADQYDALIREVLGGE
ncbi:MAG: glycosyltransferase [Verrucomicrobiota bacterium]|nr:glycosyltransferase [Verrucomicrobiota bacterium]